MTIPLLFVFWDGAGNVPPQLAVVAEAVRRGHDVRVMTHDSVRERVEATGARFVEFRRTPQSDTRSPDTDLIKDWEARTSMGALVRAARRMVVRTVAPAAHDVREELDRQPAAAVAVDSMFPGATVGAEACGTPHVLLHHTFYLLPRSGIPPIGFGLLPARGAPGRARDVVMHRLMLTGTRPALVAMNRVRRELGLDPLAGFFDHFDRAERVLVLSSPALDFMPETLPENVVYTGPAFADGAVDPWVSPWPDDGGKLVLVSLSTSYMAQERTLARVVEALGDLGARSLVTTGPAIDPGSLPLRSNVVAERFVDHRALLPAVDVVVTHAGHGTVMASLSHGVPLVCIPMGRDQHDVAARVVAHRAGLRVSPKASQDDIRVAVTTLLRDPDYRTRAERLARLIARTDGTTRAVAELEAVATRFAESQPDGDSEPVASAQPRPAS